MLYFNVQDDDHACKFFKWLDTNTCMRGATTTPIIIGKFKHFESEVEVANEELKQARAMEEAALKWEQAAERRVERAKVARKIVEKKVEKFKIVILWVMFGVLLNLYYYIGYLLYCNCTTLCCLLYYKCTNL